MIEGVVGFPGSGKTYYALDRALKAMKKGYTVYSNFGITGSELITPKTMFDVAPKSLVILDEAQLWFGSRNWRDFGDEYMQFFSQTRKIDITLLWISQVEGSVDKTIRDRTHLAHKMEAFGKGIFGHPIAFRATTYSGAVNVDKDKFEMYKSWLRFKKEVANAYDTNEILQMRQLEEKRLKIAN